jgi:hypothetical protein
VPDTQSKLHTIAIARDVTGRARVLVDNLDISDLVSSLDISMETLEPTQIQLNMVLGVLIYDQQSVVTVDSGTRELLRKLGWKEPDGRI